ncbi:hypothetical protein ACTXGO_00865 [Psychrobacter sp. T6-1]|uniref:hypothetical protein n=1 Tax=Psychrobacter sp. T6-1 TaxID=3457447 RepID=UPI003FD5CD2A
MIDAVDISNEEPQANRLLDHLRRKITERKEAGEVSLDVHKGRFIRYAKKDFKPAIGALIAEGYLVAECTKTSKFYNSDMHPVIRYSVIISWDK